MRAGLGVALVGLVVCVGCGPQWQEHARDNRLRKAMAAIEKLGGKLVVDEGYDVVIVDLSATKVTDAGLVHLKGLTKLLLLSLNNTKVTDAGLAHIKGLTNLKRLFLGLTKVTDAGLVHLKGLTNLEELALNRSGVAGPGLAHLKGLTKLKYLNLRDTNVTDASVKKLQQALPNCKILH